MRDSKEHCGGLIWSDDESEYSNPLWTTRVLIRDDCVPIN